MNQQLAPYSEKAQFLKKGLYEHYSGRQYRLVGIARDSETLEEKVVYQALYGDQDLWVRPLEMFCEMVTINDRELPRFRTITPS